ncbi:MAG TPA: hypothetical protein VFT95_09870, partial [Micromonosporaceae bacterium]|nr:hypothetical protein [Micromonosporaceae bacterium]
TQTRMAPWPAGRAIPADAVRVWRGFRSPAMALPDFLDRLNTVFIPATVRMQVDAGLDGYLPAVPAGLPGKPDTVPDETAILFWDSPQTYTDGFKTLAVRTYTLTHAAVYAPGSRADFPIPYAGEVVADQPYHLADQPADWMHGAVWHLLGGRPAGTAPADFLGAVAGALTARQRAGGFAGAIACAGADYLAYWEMRTDVPPGTPPDAAFQAAFQTVGAVLDWRHAAPAAPTPVERGLWEQWPGLSVGSGSVLNTRFLRRWER